MPSIDPSSVVVAQRLAELAIAKKATDAALLDMHELVDYCDVFVLLTGRNRRHVAAIAEDLRLFAKKELGLQCVGTEGLPVARWVLVDFGSIVVHIFDEPLRGFYDLDGLWSDAPRLPVPQDPAAAEIAQQP
ncbi:MAG: ribosome silencing factor [Myxococcales bacterium]|nr:ribosome silencing factor [Myxococcales bacterium]